MSPERENEELARLRDRITQLEASDAESRRVEASLRRERQDFLRFLDHAPYAIFATKRTGRTVYANERLTAITGYSPEDIPNMRAFLRRAFPNRRYRHQVIVQWRTSIREGSSTAFSLISKDRSRKEVEFRPAVFEDGSLVMMMFDVTERKRSEDAIRHMAYHDALTDLPNRALLNEFLTSSLLTARTKGEKLGVMLIDLDNFKEVNDRHGHLAGDVLLKTAASRLTDVLRMTDTVARVGGDEFVVLLPSIHDCKGIIHVAEKITRAFEAPVSYHNQPLGIAASIGAALYPDNGEDAETLIGNADKAMYRAKGSGEKKYFVCS